MRQAKNRIYRHPLKECKNIFTSKMEIDKETLDKMLNVITKVYDKNSKPKEKKVTLKK